MIVRVTRLFSQGEDRKYRLEMPCGGVEFVRGPEGFPRSVAKDALDKCELYGLDRRSVRWYYVN